MVPALTFFERAEYGLDGLQSPAEAEDPGVLVRDYHSGGLGE